MKAKTTQAILHAYIKLYEREKDHRVSMSQIAKECGISRSTLYAYFDSVSEIEEEIALNFYKKIQELFPFVFDSSWHGEDISGSYSDFLIFCRQNQAATQISLKQDWVKNELFPVSKKLLMQEASKVVRKEDLSACGDTCDLYIYGAYAYFLEWLERGCREPVEALAQKYINALLLFTGH